MQPKVQRSRVTKVGIVGRIEAHHRRYNEVMKSLEVAMLSE